MPGVHAKLSASAAARWLACPPSVVLTQGMKEEPSPYAEEGTKAHDIAEKKLRKYIDKSRKKIVCDDKDMDIYTDEYRDYVIEQFNEAKKADPAAKLFIEERLDYSEWANDGAGTGDAVIIADGICHILDFKYGAGYTVSAIENPQCRLYALGAISEYGMIYDFNKVKTHIFQPRKNNISTEEITVEELITWGETVVRPAAALADKGEGEFNPGEKQCKWCLARETCKARAKKNLKTFIDDGDDPSTMTLDDVAKVLPHIKEIEEWCKSIKSYALNRMLDGEHISGYKLVETSAKRKIVNEQGLIQELREHGYKDEDILELKGIANLEKLVGKKDFAIISADHVEKPKGTPTIAPLSDKRKTYEILTAEEAFKDVEVTQ
ncbi:MAG: DUF2800 domain-containing protein [Erysipelotrichaceae bacterium]|nr:DUF2800 domain-containing protein [Erysipelotrichaceae bacterium]